MPLIMGILAQGVGVSPTPPAVDSDYELLETEILTGTQATVTFSSLNSTYGSTYQHLQFRMVLRTDRAGQSIDTGIFTINGASSGYSSHELFGFNGSVGSSNETNAARILFAGYPLAGGSNAANAFSGHILDILDAFETTKNTTTRVLGGVAGTSGTTGAVDLVSGLFNNTAAVDSITFDAIGSFVTGSRFSLYGLKAA